MTGARVFLACGLLATGAFLGALAFGREYYTLPAEARPQHAHHDLLRPSGRVGLACGVLGTGLFALSLLYLVRKRHLGLRFAGSLRAWMACHVFAGLGGAALIALHSAFLPRSALGTLAFGGLLVVIVTGLFGRYIHAHVPRGPNGRELASDELWHRLRDAAEALRGRGIALELPKLVHGEAAPGRGLIAAASGLVLGDREIRRDYRRLRAEVRADPRLREHAAAILPVARRFCRDRQRLARFGELHALMRSWRFLHRWLAIVMLVLAGFHVAVALAYADLGALAELWR